jgi:hypothetical protein
MGAAATVGLGVNTDEDDVSVEGSEPAQEEAATINLTEESINLTVEHVLPSFEVEDALEETEKDKQHEDQKMTIEAEKEEETKVDVEEPTASVITGDRPLFAVEDALEDTERDKSYEDQEIIEAETSILEEESPVDIDIDIIQDILEEAPNVIGEQAIIQDEEGEGETSLFEERLSDSGSDAFPSSRSSSIIALPLSSTTPIMSTLPLPEEVESSLPIESASKVLSPANKSLEVSPQFPSLEEEYCLEDAAAIFENRREDQEEGVTAKVEKVFRIVEAEMIADRASDLASREEIRLEVEAIALSSAEKREVTEEDVEVPSPLVAENKVDEKVEDDVADDTVSTESASDATEIAPSTSKEEVVIVTPFILAESKVEQEEGKEVEAVEEVEEVNDEEDLVIISPPPSPPLSPTFSPTLASAPTLPFVISHSRSLSTSSSSSRSTPPPPAPLPQTSLTLSIANVWNTTEWYKKIPAVLASLAINLGLPFINGVMLGSSFRYFLPSRRFSPWSASPSQSLAMFLSPYASF